MTPHEQIIAKHRQTAVDLRIEAEGKRSHAKGYEQTALDLDREAEAHETIAELAERAIMGAVADQAGDIHEPEPEPDEDRPSLRPEDVEHDGPFPEPKARPEPCSGRSDAAEPVSASPIAAAETAAERAQAIIEGEPDASDSDPTMRCRITAPYSSPPRSPAASWNGRQKVEAAE